MEDISKNIIRCNLHSHGQIYAGLVIDIWKVSIPILMIYVCFTNTHTYMYVCVYMIVSFICCRLLLRLWSESFVRQRNRQQFFLVFQQGSIQERTIPQAHNTLANGKYWSYISYVLTLNMYACIHLHMYIHKYVLHMYIHMYKHHWKYIQIYSLIY